MSGAQVLLLFGSLVLSLTVPPRAHAQIASQNSAPTRITTSESRATSETKEDAQLAKQWGLEHEEWTRYRALMRGPLGVYSPNLDPLTALGIEARSDAERRRYAEMQVRVEGRRIDKLLAYQRAYDEAWKRLHPTLAPVRLSARTVLYGARSTAEPDARLAVFIKDNCPPCDARVRALQATGRAFDIYVIGSRGEDAAIRGWAARVGVDPKKVRDRTITLNHDAGRWLAVGDQGDLPAVLREQDGQWQRE